MQPVCQGIHCCLRLGSLESVVVGRVSDEIRDTGATIGDSRGSLDQVSKRIIEQLQEDGRRSYAAIGRAVGLSEAATRQRVQRLIDAGVMQIVAVTDPLTLGFRRQTMIG